MDVCLENGDWFPTWYIHKEKDSSVNAPVHSKETDVAKSLVEYPKKGYPPIYKNYSKESKVAEDIND